MEIDSIWCCQLATSNTGVVEVTTIGVDSLGVVNWLYKW
nr:MAG TPA: hypothetical protein [Caudoviricetes sp.]